MTNSCQLVVAEPRVARQGAKIAVPGSQLAHKSFRSAVAAGKFSSKNFPFSDQLFKKSAKKVHLD